MLQRNKAGAGTATRWPTPDASLVAYVEEKRGTILQVYRIQPELIREHFGTEQSLLSSGYRFRQVFEVVQNAADAILEAVDAGEDGGRILVRVSDTHLYVGNTGEPLNKDGIIALLGANSSRKRRNQIGRFGLGFKSLLALGEPDRQSIRIVRVGGVGNQADANAVCVRAEQVLAAGDFQIEVNVVGENGRALRKVIIPLTIIL
jgi:hypothetical protein